MSVFAANSKQASCFTEAAKAAAGARLQSETLQQLLEAEGAMVTQILELLFDAGLDLQACIGLTNSFGHNALHTAAEAGNIAFIDGIATAAVAKHARHDDHANLKLAKALKVALQHRCAI